MTHPNPARGVAYQSATLTDGHLDSATVEAATRIAIAAQTDGEELGSGNFGRAVRFQGHIVKFPLLTDMHGRTRTMEEARGYLMHEAGVANELAEAGHAVVPVTVYVELPDGSPALVREYGEVLESVSPEEIGGLEQALYAIETTGEYGWDVADALLVMRRQDESLFVADVGFWRVRGKTRQHGVYDSSEIPDLLSRWARDQGLSKEMQSALSTDFVRYTSGITSLVTELGESDPSDDANDVLAGMLAEDYAASLVDKADTRLSLGLPVPTDVLELIDRIEKVLIPFGWVIPTDIKPDPRRKLRRKQELRKRRIAAELEALRVSHALARSLVS